MSPSELAKQTLWDAARGCLQAHTTLGLWHLEGGEGLEQDEVEAVALFSTAAHLGSPDAQYFLGTSFLQGRGVEQNDAQAAEWMRKAADQGYAAAQFFFGDFMCADGVGIKKDLPLGKAYMELSAAQGYEAAVTRLTELRKCVACAKLVHHMICVTAFTALLRQVLVRRHVPAAALEQPGGPAQAPLRHAERTGGGRGVLFGARGSQRR
jgi:hypothetical protein